MKPAKLLFNRGDQFIISIYEVKGTGTIKHPNHFSGVKKTDGYQSPATLPKSLTARQFKHTWHY